MRIQLGNTGTCVSQNPPDQKVAFTENTCFVSKRLWRLQDHTSLIKRVGFMRRVYSAMSGVPARVFADYERGGKKGGFLWFLQERSTLLDRNPICGKMRSQPFFFGF